MILFKNNSTYQIYNDDRDSVLKCIRKVNFNFIVEWIWVDGKRILVYLLIGHQQTAAIIIAFKFNARSILAEALEIDNRVRNNIASVYIKAEG